MAQVAADITIIEPVTALAVLTDDAKYSEFYKRVRDEVSAFVPDTSTVKGRSEIAAMAYKVTRSKTAIDAAGKKLNEEARAKINAVDANRRKIRDELDALADEVRKPLTDWEDAEKKRQGDAAAVVYRIAHLSSLIHGTPEQIRADMSALEGIAIDGDIHGEDTHSVILAKKAGIDGLTAALENALRAEADARELVRLRAEAAERDRIERERIEAEAAAKAEREAASRREAEAAAREKADKDRREREAAEATARMERGIEAARLEVQRKVAVIHAAELEKIASEKRALEKAEADRVAELKRAQAETDAREKDKAHRAKVMGEVKAALMTCGADEETAKKIVLTIKAGEIPHVTLRF